MERVDECIVINTLARYRWAGGRWERDIEATGEPLQETPRHACAVQPHTTTDTLSATPAESRVYGRCAAWRRRVRVRARSAGGR